MTDRAVRQLGENCAECGISCVDAVNLWDDSGRWLCFGCHRKLAGRYLELPLAEPWPAGIHRGRPCAICGETWRPWAHSRLPCHARCLLTDEGVELVRAWWESDRGSAEALQRDLGGVTLSVVRATVHHRLGVQRR